MSAPCAICGREVAGDNHVRVQVERVPPEERPKDYYFHPWCHQNANGSWERGV